MKYQEQHGLPEDGFPSIELLEHMRQEKSAMSAYHGSEGE
jgi:hypothetical protein